MSSRADYTTPEWKKIQTAIHGTVMYVSLSSKDGLIDDFKEKSQTNKILEELADKFSSRLLLDAIQYSDPYEIPDRLDKTASAIEAEISSAISACVGIIKKINPKDLEIFQATIVELAYKTADSSNGISENEQRAIDKIIGALNLSI